MSSLVEWIWGREFWQIRQGQIKPKVETRRSKDDFHFSCQLQAMVRLERMEKGSLRQYPMHSWPRPHAEPNWFNITWHKWGFGESPWVNKDGTCGCYSPGEDKPKWQKEGSDAYPGH
jgi:hypothetical protein